MEEKELKVILIPEEDAYRDEDCDETGYGETEDKMTTDDKDQNAHNPKTTMFQDEFELYHEEVMMLEDKDGTVSEILKTDSVNDSKASGGRTIVEIAEEDGYRDEDCDETGY